MVRRTVQRHRLGLALDALVHENDLIRVADLANEVSVGKRLVVHTDVLDDCVKLHGSAKLQDSDGPLRAAVAIDTFDDDLEAIVRLDSFIGAVGDI